MSFVPSCDTRSAFSKIMPHQSPPPSSNASKHASDYRMSPGLARRIQLPNFVKDELSCVEDTSSQKSRIAHMDSLYMRKIEQEMMASYQDPEIALDVPSTNDYDNDDQEITKAFENSHLNNFENIAQKNTNELNVNLVADDSAASCKIVGLKPIVGILDVVESDSETEVGTRVIANTFGVRFLPTVGDGLSSGGSDDEDGPQKFHNQHTVAIACTNPSTSFSKDDEDQTSKSINSNIENDFQRLKSDEQKASCFTDLIEIPISISLDHEKQAEIETNVMTHMTQPGRIDVQPDKVDLHLDGENVQQDGVNVQPDGVNMQPERICMQPADKEQTRINVELAIREIQTAVLNSRKLHAPIARPPQPPTDISVPPVWVARSDTDQQYAVQSSDLHSNTSSQQNKVEESPSDNEEKVLLTCSTSKEQNSSKDFTNKLNLNVNHKSLKNVPSNKKIVNSINLPVSHIGANSTNPFKQIMINKQQTNDNIEKVDSHQSYLQSELPSHHQFYPNQSLVSRTSVNQAQTYHQKFLVTNENDLDNTSKSNDSVLFKKASGDDREMGGYDIEDEERVGIGFERGYQSVSVKRDVERIMGLKWRHQVDVMVGNNEVYQLDSISEEEALSCEDTSSCDGCRDNCEEAEKSHSVGCRQHSNKEYSTDDETEELLTKQYISNDIINPPQQSPQQCDHMRARAREVILRDPSNESVLIEGVLFRASYLGSTQLISEGQSNKNIRMMQAQEAVGRIKASDGENQPSTEVDLFVSVEKIMVLNTNLQEIMMDHSLRTISYIADIGDILVIMARRGPVQAKNNSSKTQTKICCHLFESDEAQLIAQSIGQAFHVAYVEFLKANGVEEQPGLVDYQDVLNQQEIFGQELYLFSNKDMQKEVIVSKAKGEILGLVIVESGWGSMVPTVIVANLLGCGAAARSNNLNIGDQIISINNISLVGLPLSTCQNYIKACKNQCLVKMLVVSCPPVVEVLIKRPDLKYQLGFSVQSGVICSLLRGGIAERGGVRVGHRIIEINGQSVVAVPHEKIVNMLATSVGEINMKTMPTSIFRLLTGQKTPNYI